MSTNEKGLGVEGVKIGMEEDEVYRTMSLMLLALAIHSTLAFGHLVGRPWIVRRIFL